MYSTQLAAYRNMQRSTMSERELEASVLTQAALKLKDCQDNWEVCDNSKLDEALRYNQLIWTIFQSELAKESNPLPKKIKEDILSLSIFTDKRTFDIMAYPAPEKLTAIININLNIAAGLRAGNQG
jgi:flagellar biosynthesis activator protein FlaF